jgi:hypothetical protein
MKVLPTPPVRLRLALFIVLAFMLGGCAEMRRSGGAEGELLALLEHRERLLAMPPDALREAYHAAAQEMERRPDDLSRMRLALALSIPRAPWRDDARLLSLLADIDPGATGSGRRAIAQLIRSLMLEQQRLLAEERQRLAADLQKAVREEHQRMVSERQRLVREEQRRAEEIQAKLDALLKIDRQMRQKARTR